MIELPGTFAVQCVDGQRWLVVAPDDWSLAAGRTFERRECARRRRRYAIAIAFRRFAASRNPIRKSERLAGRFGGSGGDSGADTISDVSFGSSPRRGLRLRRSAAGGPSAVSLPPRRPWCATQHLLPRSPHLLLRPCRSRCRRDRSAARPAAVTSCRKYSGCNSAAPGRAAHGRAGRRGEPGCRRKCQSSTGVAGARAAPTRSGLQGHEHSRRRLTRAGAKFLGSDVNAERAGRTA